MVTFVGRIAPGPAYKLYLAPEWVETEAEFLEVRARSARLGDVRTFENFVVPVPNTVDVSPVRHRRGVVRGILAIHHCGEVPLR